MKNKTITKELATNSLEIGSAENESRLPSDWTLASFDEVAYATDYVANGSFASLRENVRYKNEPDYAILVRLTDYTKRWQGDYVYVDKHAYDFLRKSSVEPGDIIIANVGDPGRVFRAPNLGRPMTLGPNSVLVRPKEGLETAFLQYFFMSSWGQQLIAKITTGTAQKKFNKTGLRALRIPIAPPKQQKRIVAEIEKQFSRLDEAVANLKRVKANLKRYKAAVLKAAVEGKLTEDWRKAHPDVEPASELRKRIIAERRAKWNGKGKYKEPFVPNTTNLPSVPDTWTWATIDQLSEIVTKGSSPNWQGFDYCDDGIVFVRSQNVEWGKLSLTDVARLPKEFNQKERKSILKSGDVLLNIVGASIGRAAIAPAEVEGGNVNLAVAVIRLLPNSALNSYLMFYLISVRAQKQIHSEKVDVARANFSLEDTRTLAVPLPPLVEQAWIATEIARRLSVIETLEGELIGNLNRTSRLRQTILAKAFAGSLVTSEVLTSESTNGRTP